MGRIVVTEFVSLDGVMEAPGGEPTHPHSGWVFKFQCPEQDQFKSDETKETDALLLGRVTYEGFAAAWPERSGEFADKFNTMPKHVVTSTLSDLEWENSTVLEGGVPDGVARLRDEVDGVIQVPGSCTLVHSLLQHGLIDELRLMVFPIVLGSGLKVFPQTPDMTVLALSDSRAFANGVTLQTYVKAD